MTPIDYGGQKNGWQVIRKTGCRISGEKGTGYYEIDIYP